MIYLLGTSHISPFSHERIEQEIECGPQVVAVELDVLRFRAMRKGAGGRSGSLFMGLLAWLQRKLGERTGVMPGEEMLHAVVLARERSIDAVFIDRPVKITVRALSRVSMLEKVKLIFLSLLQLVMLRFDLKRLPSYEVVHRSLRQMRRFTPAVYRVLVSERDEYMTERVVELADDCEHVLVVVGMGHVPGLLGNLKARGLEVRDRTFSS